MCGKLEESLGQSDCCADTLNYESTEEMFPTSDLAYLAAIHQLNNEAVLNLERILDNFRTDIGNMFLSLYVSVSDTFNDNNDHLIFYCDVYSETCYERRWLLF